MGNGRDLEEHYFNVTLAKVGRSLSTLLVGSLWNMTEQLEIFRHNTS